MHKHSRDGYYPHLTVLYEAVNRVIVRHLWLLIHSSVKVMEACSYNSINVDILADGTSALADDSPAGVQYHHVF